MLEIIQYGEIKKYKKYRTLDLNTNSKLYIDNEIMYKIPCFIDLNFKKVLEYINELNLNEIIELKNLIYDKDILVGYSFKNYKEYKSLRKIKNRDLKLKKQDCIKIIKGYDLLSKNNLKYSDFHRGNILLNEYNNGIKICDIDGISLLNDKSLEKRQLRCAMKLCLAYLYNIYYYDIRNVLDSSGIKYRDSFINECKGIIEDITVDKIISLLNTLDYNSISIERKEIISTSKQLSKTGYDKFRRF